MQVIDHVLLHVVFSTKAQRPVLVDDALRSAVHAAMRDTLGHSLNACVAVGGTADHVHIALYLSRKMTVNRVVDLLKKDSVRLIRAHSHATDHFAWQQGFAAFSVALTDRDALMRYIETQSVVHRSRDFKSEMRAMFAKYDVGFDERFVWK